MGPAARLCADRWSAMMHLPFVVGVPPAQWPAETPRKHEQAAAHEGSRGRRPISDVEDA
jgi:hypothetical protein